MNSYGGLEALLHSGEAITNFVQESINEKSIVYSDKSSSYIDICKYVEEHLMDKYNAHVVHIAISYAKRTFLAVFLKINGDKVQRYLNEFVHQLNRRYCRSIYERLGVASVFTF